MKLIRTSFALLAVSLLSVGAIAADKEKDHAGHKSGQSATSTVPTDGGGNNSVTGTAPGGRGASGGATGAPVGSGSTGNSGFHSTGQSGTTSAGTENDAKGVTGGAK